MLSILNKFTLQYEFKRCSKKDCCKQCRYVKYKGNKTKWAVQKPTHRTTEKHVEHQDAQTFRRRKNYCFSDFFSFLFIIYYDDYMIND